MSAQAVTHSWYEVNKSARNHIREKRDKPTEKSTCALARAVGLRNQKRARSPIAVPT